MQLWKGVVLMAKGKYAVRADARLRALETEAVCAARAQIHELTTALTAARHQVQMTEADITGKAMAIAERLVIEEKKRLTQRIEELEHTRSADRVRQALLTWEIMHRNRFGTPAPLKMGFNEELTRDSYEFWLTCHWEIAALFCTDYDEIHRFFEQAEGYSWRLAGDGPSNYGYEPLAKQTSREATRRFRKGHLRDMMMNRVVNMRAYYDRIVFAREHDQTEPVLTFADANPADACPEDTRDGLIEKIKEKGVSPS
jgi:hypothetical protein